MENKTLQLTDWKFAGFWPYTPFRYGAELNNPLDSQTDWMDAQVPGSVYADLERNRIIKDPYYEMNALDCEWVSNRWWAYRTEFALPLDYQDGCFKLVFKGIDYKADIFFNGEKLGTHEGMFLPFEADVTSLVKKDGASNLLTVVLQSTPDEMGQIGYTSHTKTQRSRFYYKWDFCTRMVGVGLYDSVILKYIPRAAMTERHIETIKEDDSWSISTDVYVESCQGSDMKIRLRLFDKETLVKESSRTFLAQKRKQKIRISLNDLYPELWWPNGYGNPRLYTLRIELLLGDTLLHETVHPIGFRTIEYVQCEGRHDDSLPYQPIVNGKRIYIKGVNVVPFDHRQGMVTEKRYRTYLELCQKAGFDLVRLWGGGVIERDEFYTICDELGILVWQEFIQSSSGLESTPSEDPHFLLLLKDVSTNAIKYIRNHPSILFFSGGNELFDKDFNPCSYNNININMLKKLVDELDGNTMMLPTSASGPYGVIQLDKPGQSHDVHGPWKLYGPQAHYDLFNQSDAILQSEFGCDGFSSLTSLQKFLSPENLKVDTAKNNLVWRYHGEWWDTYNDRERLIFGEFQEDDLSNLIKCNQFMQAEGLRYGLEANRRRAFRNCGSIIWQFNEPWPNVFCTCIVDYYATPKMAYYSAAEAFASRTVLLEYSNILQLAGTSMKLSVSVANDFEQMQYSLELRFCDHLGEEFYCKTLNGEVAENAVANAGEFIFDIPSHVNKGFTIDAVLRCGEDLIQKRYVLLTKAENDAVYDRAIAIAHFDRIMGQNSW